MAVIDAEGLAACFVTHRAAHASAVHCCFAHDLIRPESVVLFGPMVPRRLVHVENDVTLASFPVTLCWRPQV